jgi:hypothetical protein
MYGKFRRAKFGPGTSAFVAPAADGGQTYANVGFQRVRTFKRPLVNGKIWSACGEN